MNGLAPPPLSVTTSDAFGGRRVSFEEESLFEEARDHIIGTFHPVEEIFWEEVEAVYVWRSIDWGMLCGGLFLVLLGAAFIRLILASFVLEGFVALMVTLVLPLVMVAVLAAAVIFGAARVFPRWNVRVVGDGREIRFYTLDGVFMRSLWRRLQLPGQPP